MWRETEYEFVFMLQTRENSVSGHGFATNCVRTARRDLRARYRRFRHRNDALELVRVRAAAPNDVAQHLTHDHFGSYLPFAQGELLG